MWVWVRDDKSALWQILQGSLYAKLCKGKGGSLICLIVDILCYMLLCYALPYNHKWLPSPLSVDWVRVLQPVLNIFLQIAPSPHSGLSGGWEERTKLREKITLKFINITLSIIPTAVTIKLMKLRSWNSRWSWRFTRPNFHQKMAEVIWALQIAVFGILLIGKPKKVYIFVNIGGPYGPICMNIAQVYLKPFEVV